MAGGYDGMLQIACLRRFLVRGGQTLGALGKVGLRSVRPCGRSGSYRLALRRQRSSPSVLGKSWRRPWGTGVLLSRRDTAGTYWLARLLAACLQRDRPMNAGTEALHLAKWISRGIEAYYIVFSKSTQCSVARRWFCQVCRVLLVMVEAVLL